MLQQKPNAKLAILYQNDDFGKDYPNGVKDALGDKFDKMVVTATYETTDPTIDSQITTLQASGADVLLVAAIPKFAAQAIRKVHDLNWKPMFFMSNVAISVGAVMTLPDRRTASASSVPRILKDSSDPTWKDDAGMNEWREFMTKRMPGADQTDGGYIAAYGLCKTMLQVLQQANGDFSRANIMKQVTSLHDVENPVTLPGIKLNTSPTNYHPITAMQLEKWDGKTWVLFGDVIQGAGPNLLVRDVGVTASRHRDVDTANLPHSLRRVRSRRSSHARR